MSTVAHRRRPAAEGHRQVPRPLFPDPVGLRHWPTSKNSALCTESPNMAAVLKPRGGTIVVIEAILVVNPVKNTQRHLNLKWPQPQPRQPLRRVYQAAVGVEAEAEIKINTNQHLPRGQNPNTMVVIVALAPVRMRKASEVIVVKDIIIKVAAEVAAKTEVPVGVEDKISSSLSNAITAVARNSLQPRSSVPHRKKSAVVV